MSAVNNIDGYKTSHRKQYPEGTTKVLTNLTARSDKHAKGSDGQGVVVFGSNYMVRYLQADFYHTFFNVPKRDAVKRFKRRMDNYLGKDSVAVDHIEALHDLQHLPIIVKSLPEGSLCPIGVPFLTVTNTLPEFFWITNFLETVISSLMWQLVTNATTARLYKKIMLKYAEETGADKDGVVFQCHDFSMRGMPGPEAAAASGAAHLTSFVGTDCVPAIDFMEMFYQANSDKELVGASIPATEHSVMCMGGKDDEIGTFRRLITEIHPTGLVGVVSDTWDLWKVITEYVPALKDEIMARDGTVVFRPDSGDPADIICGKRIYIPHEYESEEEEKATREELQTPECKGLVECLWDIFGGTVNDDGYKVLDSHVGAIYGDSIDLARAEDILERLKAKGFCSSNIVFGVGSYTYQFNTRDTYGMALKATYGEINGVGVEIFKDPATDVDKTKKSAKGLICVEKAVDGTYYLIDQCTKEEEAGGCLEVIFDSGTIMTFPTMKEIRDRVMDSITKGAPSIE